MASSAPPTHESPSRGHEFLESFWGPLGGQPVQHFAPFPCSYPAVPCYSLLHPPPFRLLAQQVPAPCEQPPGPPLLWPGPLLCSPLLPPGPVEDTLRAKAGPSRESTAALKAWLGQHLKNPYPSKGEKVLLALVSRMSLTQVSTWFANARRRLKKENRACWTPRPPKADGEEQEEGAAGGSSGELVPGGKEPPSSSTPPKARPFQGPQRDRLAATARAKAEQGALVLPPRATCHVEERAEPQLPKPTIWSVAELATGPQSGGAPV